MRSFRLNEWGYVLLVSLALIVCMRLILQHYIVDQHSMEPTLRTGQYILINRLAYLRLEPGMFGSLVQPKEAHTTTAPSSNNMMIEPFGRPQLGDIIVFDVSGGETMVKRIIGLPGEVISIRQQTVFINDTLLNEPYLDARLLPVYTMQPRQVAPDEYFVLGDNRNLSYDSHSFGTIPRRSIVGRALV